MTTLKPKLIIFGIDGASYHLIKNWVGTGKLPTFELLMNNGISGRLRSTIPPLTPTAWTSFMTGKNPGSHGIFDFIEHDDSTYGIKYTNSSFRRAESIWSILNKKGFSTGVINVPMTFPPEHVNGYMISGLDTPDIKSEFFFPSDYRKELEGVLGSWKLDVRHLGNMKTDEDRKNVLKTFEEIEEQRTEAGLYLLKNHPVDVMMIVFNTSDQVQHHFWHYMDEFSIYYDEKRAGEFKDAILNVYKKIDSCMHRFIDVLPAETTVMVMSDHGAGPVGSCYIYLNRFLEEIGLLKWRKSSLMNKLTASHLKKIERLLKNSLSHSQKQKIVTIFPGLRERFESKQTLGFIDWTETKAYSSELAISSPCIWINVRGKRPHGTVKDGKEYHELTKYISDKLLELKHPITGNRLIHNVYSKSEIYKGSFLDKAPDLMIEWWNEDGILSQISTPYLKNPIVVPHKTLHKKEQPKWTAVHRLDGTIVIKGDMYRKNQVINTMNIIDIAPMILYTLGLSVPSDFEGRIWEELFLDRFISANPIHYDKTDEEDRIGQRDFSPEESLKIEKRLKDLGYL